MTRKQKKMLIRIIVSAALLLLCKVMFKLVELPDAYSPYIKFVAYMIPYFTTLPKLILCGIFVVFIGCSAKVVWAFFGTKIQSLYMLR